MVCACMRWRHMQQHLRVFFDCHHQSSLFPKSVSYWPWFRYYTCKRFYWTSCDHVCVCACVCTKQTTSIEIQRNFILKRLLSKIREVRYRSLSNILQSRIWVTALLQLNELCLSQSYCIIFWGNGRYERCIKLLQINYLGWATCKLRCWLWQQACLLVRIIAHAQHIHVCTRTQMTNVSQARSVHACAPVCVYACTHNWFRFPTIENRLIHDATYHKSFSTFSLKPGIIFQPDCSHDCVRLY